MGNTVKIRKLQYMRHVKNRHLLQFILQGKILGKRDVGRRRISGLKNLWIWFGMNTIELFRAVTNKVTIACVCQYPNLMQQIKLR